MLPENRDHLLKENGPWLNNPNDIWLATRLTLRRNLDHFNFVGKLSLEHKRQIISIVSNLMLSMPHLKNVRLERSEELAPLEKEFLYEHFLSSDPYQDAQGGEAFISEESGLFLILLNIQDHLQLQLFDIRQELEHSWNSLIDLETALAKKIEFAFSPKFGFLTARPEQCGTGMQAMALLQLTAINHHNKLEDILEKHLGAHLFATGLHGDPSLKIGDLVQVQNRSSLSVSEETILSSLRSAATKLLVLERGLRSRLKEEQNKGFKDKVYRAYGLLKHSLSLEPIEALNALSLLKLGLDVGWVSGLDHSQLNEMLFSARRAHLLFKLGGDAKMAGEKRALYIQEHLLNASLK
ncbi:MAG: hypothetical protein K0S07_1124 [Chlamydiales bacterium]|jgi:protein arginine kinase|nr:hypothetical protein [Chlamydiales bacterium]